MPAHQKAFDRLALRIRQYDGDRDWQDALLDRWVDYRDRATEWDADQWGLRDLEPVFEEFDRNLTRHVDA